MGFISWLTGRHKEKQKELERERKLEDRFRKWEQSITSSINRLIDSKLSGNAGLLDSFLNTDEPDTPLTEGIKINLSNDTLIVVLSDGSILTTTVGGRALYEKVIRCVTEEEIRDLMLPEVAKKEREELKEKAKKERKEKELLDGLDYLIESGEFERKDGSIYMKGIPISVPRLVAEEFVKFLKEAFDSFEKDGVGKPHQEYLEDKYLALKRFWMWCSLNPDANVREDLFKFLQNHDLTVNRNGFFFTYRRVVTSAKAVQEDVELTEFISESYLRIRTKWKKNPANFYVIRRDEGGYVAMKLDATVAKNYDGFIGNLKELYDNLHETTEQVFTDNHTRTFDIRIGKEVRMQREDCDPNRQEQCSKGLHTGNKKFGFNGFGDTPILCLINPIDVVSVPAYDSDKMRSCAYLPVAVLNMEESTTFLENADVLNLCDHYFSDQVSKLEEMVKRNKPTESSRNILFPENHTKESINLVVNDLGAIKSKLASRVKKV